MNEITNIMEKLELKHLTSYLPFGLKFVSSMDKPFDELGKQPIWTLNGVSEIFGGYCLLTKENNDAYAIVTCKPILRPLSDLTKEIEHNGERFVPIDILNSMKIVKNISEGFNIGSFWIDQRGGSYLIKSGEMLELPYGLFQKLIEWHFDIYSLIEKSLAIDINTLKSNVNN